MSFLKHPQRIAREAANAEAFRAAGVDPALAPEFDGEFIRYCSPPYNQDRKLSNPAFDAIAWPQWIAYCESYSDVAYCLRLAHDTPFQFVCRSGGHSTAGYSTTWGSSNNPKGLVIDTSRLNSMSVQYFQDGPFGFFGPGVQFGELNKFLKPDNLHIPGGGCTNVRIGGYMQGGGYGFTSREFGMHCDNVFAILMMVWDPTARNGQGDGKFVYADNEIINTDLHWAVCGGTGNNFGVLLNASYQLHTLPGIWGVWLEWPLNQGVTQAANALSLLQTRYMASGAPKEFGYMVLMTGQGSNNTPLMMVRAMFDGSRSDLDNLLQPLRRAGGVFTKLPSPMQNPGFGAYADMNVALMEKPYDIPQLPPNWGEDKQSGYIEKMLQVSDWENILTYFLTAFSGNNPWNYLCPYTTLVLEPMGGQINAVAPNWNAFVHRRTSMDFFVDVFWDMNGNQEQPAKQWLDGFMSNMGPGNWNLFNRHCYQNYPRANLVGLPGYKEAFWGSNYNELVQVKKKWDPANFFTFPQAINPNDTGVTAPAAASPIAKYLSQPINYSTEYALRVPRQIKR